MYKYMNKIMKNENENNKVVHTHKLQVTSLWKWNKAKQEKKC